MPIGESGNRGSLTVNDLVSSQQLWFAIRAFDPNGLASRLSVIGPVSVPGPTEPRVEVDAEQVAKGKSDEDPVPTETDDEEVRRAAEIEAAKWRTLSM